MKYMGSKKRLQKYIAPIIQTCIDDNNANYYIEPFVGGCNMFETIKCNFKYGYDNNQWLIYMLDYTVKYGTDKMPHTIDKELYSKMRDLSKKDAGGMSDCQKAIVGWCGFMASYNGRFYDGGYSGHAVKEKYKDGYKIRDMIAETIRNYEAQLPKLQDWKSMFIYDDYSNIKISSTCSMVIYCDPPYKGTKQYNTSKNFDYEKYYKQCESWAEHGYTVLMSEYWMPESRFKCIWSKELKTNMMNTQGGKRKKNKEKLFIVR